MCRSAGRTEQLTGSSPIPGANASQPPTDNDPEFDAEVVYTIEHGTVVVQNNNNLRLTVQYNDLQVRATAVERLASPVTARERFRHRRCREREA